MKKLRKIIENYESETIFVAGVVVAVGAMTILRGRNGENLHISSATMKALESGSAALFVTDKGDLLVRML